MTCLVPPSAFAAAGQPDDSAAGRRARCISQVGAAFQRLLDQWRGLGLELDVFLPTHAALPRLSAWSDLQLGQLQQVLTALADNPQACRELAAGLRSLALGSDAGASAMAPAGWTRTLLWLRPFLSLQGLTRHCSAPALPWPQLPGDPLAMPLDQLGLSIRALNRLRRNGMAYLADLAGLDANGLLAIRGMGAASVQEVADLLERQGLTLPFSPADGMALPPLSASAVSCQSQVRLGRVAADGPSPLEIPRAEQSAAGRDWSERAIALLSCLEEGRRPERALQALQALTVERFPSLRQRLEEIHQLRELLRSVEIGARLTDMETRQCGVWQEAVQQQLLRRYSELLAGGDSTIHWFMSLRKHLHRYPQCLHLLLLHLPGRSLRAISQASRPPVSHEQVRHQIQTLEALLGMRVKALRASCQQKLAREDSERKAAVLNTWIAAHGRLPFHTDAEAPAAGQGQDVMDLCRQVRNLSLSRRLALHAELGLPVPEAEWDLHFRVLTNGEEYPGTGYWHSLEPLRQYLPRFAALAGSPGVMPQQTKLPPSVHGAVGRHGGHCKVARQIGMKYKGQLVGEHGRTYWTDLRLEQLLEQTVSFCHLPVRAMPSRLQIRAFMESGLVAEYADKKFPTVFAALTRQSTLSWPQVAQRFGRI